MSQMRHEEVQDVWQLRKTGKRETAHPYSMLHQEPSCMPHVAVESSRGRSHSGHVVPSALLLQSEMHNRGANHLAGQ